MRIQRFIANNGFGTNMYLAWDEESKKAFFVDPGAPCEAAVKTIKEHELDLSCIILTHGHGDHTGGLKYFQEQFPDAKVISGRHERRWLFERKTGFTGGIKADVEVKSVLHRMPGTHTRRDIRSLRRRAVCRRYAF